MVTEKDVLILIPAFNEQGRIGEVIAGVRRALPGVTILVVDDGSTDQTAEVSLSSGAVVLTHPFNLGVGGALQTGYKFSVKHGFKYVVQLDGDGQHPPEYLPAFLSRLNETEADLIIGSRFLHGYRTSGSFLRRMGNATFAKILSLLIRERLTDPTSGYRALKQTALKFCVQDVYGFDYPDADFLLTLHRAGFRIEEIPFEVQARSGGRSQHAGLAPFYYIIKMCLSIFIILLRKRNA
jgi:glycosyltransferase involved in cell wall biosynthesis